MGIIMNIEKIKKIIYILNRRTIMSEKICLCKGITKDTIVEAIKNGADSIEAVKEATGATTGFCHGGRCKSKIEELIEENK
ncbi:BFD (2Fe-2S)-binding domain-containing protein [[Clostridium] sordellii]|nr:BFD (2Fe-2S)-binding domain-containing protein [[Clostridium] sordellii] [Paeniclostridium sordellii]